MCTNKSVSIVVTHFCVCNGNNYFNAGSTGSRVPTVRRLFFLCHQFCICFTLIIKSELCMDDASLETLTIKKRSVKFYLAL